MPAPAAVEMPPLQQQILNLAEWVSALVDVTVGPAAVATLKERIGRELKTTFASTFSAEISLAETLHLDVIARYRKRETGKKFLVNPSRA